VTLRVKATLKYSPTYKGGNISHNAPSAHCRPRGRTNTCARLLRAYTDSLAVLGKREITKRRNGVISRSFLPAVLFSEITRDFFVRDTLREGRTADELDIMDSLDSCRDSVPPPMTSTVIPKEQPFGDDVRLLLLPLGERNILRRDPSLRRKMEFIAGRGATSSRTDENATLAKRKSHDPQRNQLFLKHNWARSLRHEINTSCRVSVY